MRDEPTSVLSRHNVKDLIHIKEDLVPSRFCIVVLVTAEEVFDLREGFLDGVEIRRVRQKILDPNAETISELEELVAVVDLGVVEDQDTERAGVGAAEWELQ